MNDDLQNALEQLRRCAAGQRQAMPPTPKEAQALLDERDALLEGLGDIACTLEGIALTESEHPRQIVRLAIKQQSARARAIVAKAQNGKV